MASMIQLLSRKSNRTSRLCFQRSRLPFRPLTYPIWPITCGSRTGLNDPILPRLPTHPFALSEAKPSLLGGHYFSNATCLTWPHLCYAYFVVSRMAVNCYIIRQFWKHTCVRQVVADKWFPLNCVEPLSWRPNGRTAKQLLEYVAVLNRWFTICVCSCLTPSPPIKRFRIKSPWVKLSGSSPIKLYGRENSAP